MLLDFLSLEPNIRYKWMSQIITPRPIAWIVTEAKNINIAPFSFFSGISSNPPTVMVAVGHKGDDLPKDTLRNIREQKRCVICSVEPKDLEKMHQSSQSLEFGVSEAQAFGIEMINVVEGFPPIVSGVKTAMFCTLMQEVNIEACQTVPLFLKVEQLYIDDTIYRSDANISLELLGRLGKHYMAPGRSVDAPKM